MTAHLALVRNALIASCSLIAAGGCVTQDPRLEQPEQAPPLVAKQRSLNEDASDRVLQSALGEYRNDPAVRELIDEVRLYSTRPLTVGNQVAILIDGPQTFEALEAAIATARHHVHVETFIFGADETGRHFAELLKRKRSEGVLVRVIYDSIGSMDTPKAFFDELREHGVEVREFRPMNPIETPLVWKIHQRDHRKIIVVDGRVGFTGGINIDDTYSSASASSPGPRRGLTDGWRDTHVRIEGPVVRQLQALFIETWNETGDPFDFVDARYFPLQLQSGSALITIVDNDSAESDRSLYGTYLAAFTRAHSRLWITHAYFAPNDELLQAMTDAVERGVDVRLIVPGFSDSNIVLQATRATYTRLLEGGVKIYELEDALLHAKSVVADGAVSIIGSANLDMRSFLHNNEVNAIIVSRPVAARMEEVFRRDQARAQAVSIERWKKRSVWQRLREWYANMVGYWL